MTINFITPQNLQLHCFRFFLGHLHVPGEITNNDYAKCWGGGGGKRGVLWSFCKWRIKQRKSHRGDEKN